MLLSIDESKIAEMLKSGQAQYAVENVPIATENLASVSVYPATTEVYAVAYGEPMPVTEETRQHLISLRHEIEKSGVRLKGAEELTREIDEMRGRR